MRIKRHWVKRFFGFLWLAAQAATMAVLGGLALRAFRINDTSGAVGLATPTVIVLCLFCHSTTRWMQLIDQRKPRL